MSEREQTDTNDPRPEKPAGASRREFLASAALVGGPLLVSPRVAFGSEANSRVTLGAIGCGGRGTWIGDLFQKHGGYQITAAEDLIPGSYDYKAVVALFESFPKDELFQATAFGKTAEGTNCGSSAERDGLPIA